MYSNHVIEYCRDESRGTSISIRVKDDVMGGGGRGDLYVMM